MKVNEFTFRLERTHNFSRNLKQKSYSIPRSYCTTVQGTVSINQKQGDGIFQEGGL